MSEHAQSASVYVLVFAVLVALTVLTIGVSFIPLAGVWHVVVGMGIALVKASLVVLFFMHAVHSPRITWIVIGASIVWLGILLALTLCDYLTRGRIPHLPGH